MAVVVYEYPDLVIAGGKAYRARAWAAPARDRTPRWQGWIEFLPVSGGPPVRVFRETTQPNRVCALYWATGLRSTYLEGALARALRLARGITGVSFELWSTGGAADPSWPYTVRAAGSRRRPSRAVQAGQGWQPTVVDRLFLKSLGIAAE